jgi:cyclase
MDQLTSMMERVTPNVYTTTRLRGCNPSFVVTSDGVVVIDTPQLPTRAVAMRREAESFGPIRYVINTEHHVDHVFGNYYFKGAGQVVHHQGVYDNFMVPTPDLDPYAYAAEAIPTDDPEGASIFPDRDTYYADPNKATIVFSGDLTLRVGDHTFHLLHTPGHTPGQIAVYVPEERVVFTGDTIFSECQTWLMTSDVDQWLVALERIRQLDVDHLVPGHGPVTTLDYIHTQRAVLLEWEAAVAAAVAKGWSREETMARVRFDDRYPVDVGQGYMMDHIQTLNAASLWDKFTRRRGAESGPKEPGAIR